MLQRFQKFGGGVCFALFMLICLTVIAAEPAQAAVLQLPSGVKTIEAEAFYGDTSLDEVVLPEGLTAIGSRAFADSSLTGINLPASLTEIDDSIFHNVSGLTVTAIPGTYAYQWAVRNGYIEEQAEESPLEWFEFTDNGNGTCTLVGYAGPAANSADIVIPRENGDRLKVAAIGEDAFRNCSGLTGHLIIPSGVTEISRRAFSNCSGLTGSLTIPRSVTSLGNAAFYNCSSLTGNLVISENVTTIGISVFYNCRGLTGSLVIPEKVTSIGGSAFQNCSGLTGSLVIPTGVTSIGNAAFSGCSGLTGSLVIPAGITSIGSSTFSNCSGLTGSLVIPDGVTEIGNDAFYNCSSLSGSPEISADVTLIGKSAFYNCSSLTGSLHIPEGVVSIGDWAFGFCSGLDGSLHLPEGLTSIGSFAFYNCSGLTGSLDIPKGVTVIGEYAFADCRSLNGSLSIQEGVTSIGNGAFSGCSGLTGSLVIPAGVMSIGESAFANCSSLDGSLVIHAGVTAIGNDAFRNCSSLIGSLELPAGITTIGNGAFANCSGLTGSLVLPQGVTGIGNSAFDFCSGFTGELIIPAEVTSIGERAFYNCYGFTGSLVIPEGVTSIGDSAFYNCYGFTGSLVIPGSVTSIGSSAFLSCYGLNGSLMIQPGVTSIGNSAFYNCYGFTGNLIIPAGVTSIGDQAFFNCYGFNGSLSIPTGVTTIGSETFASCGFTGGLYIPQGVTSIGYGAFSWCGGLNGRLRLPAGIASIGDNAFFNCGFTGSLVIPEGVTSIGSSAFFGCNNLTGSIVIPRGVTAIGDSAFKNCSGLTYIAIPESVSAFGENLFTYCLRLQRIYCIPNSNAWNWCTNNGLARKLIEWDGSLASLPGEVQLSGSFAGDSMTVSIGDRVIPAAAVQSVLGDIYRVTLTISDYNQDGTDANRYATYVCADDHTKEFSLKDYDEFTLDTAREPFNTPGTYTINLWASVAEGEGIKLDSMTVYVGWVGYVQISRAPTYPDAVSMNDEGQYVDDARPVTVFSEKGERYYIEYVSAAGGTLKRWVDKQYIAESDYYLPWVGYVLNERVDTYPTADGTAVNGYVDNLDPVTVLGESSDRYYISMILTGGGSAFRWVEKQYITAVNPAGGNVQLSGQVLTEDRLPIPNVTVAVSIADGQLVYRKTGADGRWSVDGMPMNQQITVICEKEPFMFEPVSMNTDNVQMQMEIIGTAAGSGYLFADVDVLRALSAGEQLSFTVTGSQEWTAVCEGTGITASVSQGQAGLTEVTVEFARNAGMARTGKYTITSGNSTAVVYLLQLGELSNRIPDPVITYPATNDAQVPFNALNVTWNEVEGAESYVVSLRDTDTGVLIFSHETAQGLSMMVPTEYFADDHKYRVAVGAVPGGVLSTDPSVSWCERLFTVLPEEGEEPYITGDVYVNYDIQARGYNDGAGNNMTDEQLNNLIGVNGQPVANVRVHISHYDETSNEDVADGFITTDKNGHYDSRQIEGSSTGAPLVLTNNRFYTFTYIDPKDQITFRTEYKNIQLKSGENAMRAVFGVREIETWQGDDPYASIVNRRPQGLYAEYFAYDGKPGTNADEWKAELKRNEGSVSRIDFNWESETVKEGFWSSGSKNYNVLKAWPYNDDTHSGSPLMSVNFVPQKFSVRFNGFIQLNGEDGAKYKFRVRGDDGVAITLQTDKISKYSSANGWRNGGNNSSVVTLPAGMPRGYVVHVEILHYNKGGDAKLILEYSNDARLKDSESTWITVPDDWLYQGSRTIWISERTGIMNVYQAKLDSVNERIKNWSDKKVEDYLQDIISQIGGAVLPEFSLADNLFGDVRDSYIKAFGAKFASNVESTIKSKLTNSIYGAVAGKLAGTANERTLWQEITERVAEEFQVDVSEITPRSLASDTFDAFITYGEVAEYVHSHQPANRTPTQAKMDQIFYHLSFSDIDHIKEADRLNPHATMASIIIQQKESEETVIDKAKLLQEIKDDEDTNNIISLAENGMKLIKEVKEDGNRTRATMSLLYAEQGKEFALRLFNAHHSNETGHVLYWYQYFNNNLGSRKSFETRMTQATDSVAASLLAELEGVNLQEIMLKEVYIMTLDAVESYYSGLIKGLEF